MFVKAPGKANQVLKGFAGNQFKQKGPPHFAQQGHAGLVFGYPNHVLILEADVVALIGAEQKIVEVDGAHHAVAPNHLNAAEGTGFGVGATGQVERVEGRPQRGDGIRTWPDYFAHQRNADAADFAYRSRGVGAAAGGVQPGKTALPQAGNNALFGLLDGEAAHHHRGQIRQFNGAFRRNAQFEIFG